MLEKIFQVELGVPENCTSPKGRKLYKREM